MIVRRENKQNNETARLSIVLESLEEQAEFYSLFNHAVIEYMSPLIGGEWERVHNCISREAKKYAQDEKIHARIEKALYNYCKGRWMNGKNK